MNRESFSVRQARPEDILDLLTMIHELAVFENLEDQLVTTEDDLQRELFDTRGGAEALVADDGGGPLAAYAIYFHNFSSFLCRPGLYLEDVYVRPAYRKRGIARAMLTRLAQIAAERECRRFEWAVLDWNQNAIDFYESLGAKILDEWRIVRLDQDAIARLAAMG